MCLSHISWSKQTMLKRQSIINCKKRVALNINYVKVEQKLKSISQSGNLKLSFTLFDEKQLPQYSTFYLNTENCISFPIKLPSISKYISRDGLDLQWLKT